MEDYSAEIKFSKPSFTTLALSYDADITHQLERGEDVHLVAIGEMKSELTEVFEKTGFSGDHSRNTVPVTFTCGSATVSKKLDLGNDFIETELIKSITADMLPIKASKVSYEYDSEFAPGTLYVTATFQLPDFTVKL
jgi:hypothetical protein